MLNKLILFFFSFALILGWATNAEARRGGICGNNNFNNNVFDQIFGNNLNNIPIFNNGFNNFSNGFNNFNNNFFDPFNSLNQFGNNFFNNGFNNFNNGFNNGFFNNGNFFNNFNNGLNNAFNNFNNGINNFFGQGFAQIPIRGVNGQTLAINGFRNQFGQEEFSALIDPNTGRTQSFSIPRDAQGNPLDAVGNILEIRNDGLGPFLVGVQRNPFTGQPVLNANGQEVIARIPTRGGQLIRPQVIQLAGNLGNQNQNQLGQLDGNNNLQAGIPSGNGAGNGSAAGGGQINAEAPQPHAPLARGIVSNSDVHSGGAGDLSAEVTSGRPEL